MKKRKKSRQILCGHLSPYHLTQWKKARAKVRYLIKKKKQESFHSFIGTINCNTPSKTIWNKIKAINGEVRTSTSTLGNPNLEKETRVEKFVDHFTRFKLPVDSSNIANIFREIEEMEQDRENIPTITIAELNSSLQKVKHTSPVMMKFQINF